MLIGGYRLLSRSPGSLVGLWLHGKPILIGKKVMIVRIVDNGFSSWAPSPVLILNEV